MFLELKSRGVEVEPSLREHIERRLMFALSRFGSRVSKVSVTLADNNGPKGGIDKSCQIVIRLHGVGEVIAEVVDSEWSIAVDRAMNRIGHNVSRALERLRDFEHEPVSGSPSNL